MRSLGRRISIGSGKSRHLNEPTAVSRKSAPPSPGEAAGAGSPFAGADSPSDRRAEARRTEKRINAVKRSAVSTGQLRRLPVLHTRPIYLVVFQEPSPRRAGDLILQWVSRLDAFSVYPGRT